MRLPPIAPTMILHHATEIVRRIDDNAAASAKPSTAPLPAIHSPLQSPERNTPPARRLTACRGNRPGSLPPCTSRTAGAVSLSAVSGRLVANDVAAGCTTVDRTVNCRSAQGFSSSPDNPHAAQSPLQFCLESLKGRRRSPIVGREREARAFGLTEHRCA